jgi:TonB family protein
MPASLLRLILRLFPSVLAGSFLLACGFPIFQGSQNVLTGKYPTGVQRYHVEVDSLGRKHGSERWWHDNGRPRTEASWVAGVREGVYRAWHPDGTLWYEGRDSLGVPVDTLRFWHPNGQLQSLSTFLRGQPASLETWDAEGLTAAQRAQRDADEAERVRKQRLIDSLGVAQVARNAALALWVPRVRATVETYWKVPESMKKTPRRAVARLRVAPSGALLDVTWLEKSGSAEYDRRAAQALTKIRKFPPPPPELGSAPISLRYEFTTVGTGAPRRRLQVRDPGDVGQ